MTNFRTRKAGPGGYNDIYWNREALKEVIGTWNEGNEPTVAQLQDRINGNDLKAENIGNGTIAIHDTKTDDDYTLYYDYNNDGKVQIYELGIN